MQLLISRLSLVFALSMLLATLGVFSASSTVHADTSTACVDDFNGDLELDAADSPCEIAGVINGNIKMDGGIVRVLLGAFINGNIEQKGVGGVDILGTVNGNVKEEGEGTVFVQATGTVDGNIEEKDDNSPSFPLLGVITLPDTFVNGNIKADGGGGCLILGGVNGNLEGDCAP